MKLKNLFSKIFNRKPITTSTAVASFSDLIILPTREEFTRTKENLQLLERIKREYATILASKKSISLCDLDIGNFRDDMNMYIELLFNQIETEEDKKFSFKKAYEEESAKEIDFLIKMAKLKSYSFNIDRLISEAIARLIALNEILREKIFLSPTKKRLIHEEINGLSSCLLVFQNQHQAINSELQSYLKKFENMEEEIQLPQEQSQEILSQKHRDIISMLTALIPSFANSNTSENPFLNVALLEETLEKYIYTHKSDIETLRGEQNNLIACINNATNPKNYLPTILGLEKKLQAFAMYGHNLVTQEDIYTLYNLKFKCLTSDIYNEEKLDIAQNANYTELECYQEIISRKISNLIQGETNYFVKGKKETIKAIVQILKSGKEFSFWDILTDKTKLSFLLAFEKEPDLSDFYKKTRTSTSEFSNVNLYPNIITLEENPTLECICMLLSIDRATSKNPFYQIYPHMASAILPLFYRIPEGVTSIDATWYTPPAEEKFSIIGNLRYRLQNKFLLIPSTMKSIKGPVFESLHLENINMLEGIEELQNKVFASTKARRVHLPATLRDVDETVFHSAEVDYLYIEEYKQTSLTQDSIKNLIKSFFQLVKTDTLTPINATAKSKLYKDYEDMYRDYQAYPTFKELILEDGEESIRIPADDLVFCVKRMERKYYNKNIRRKETYHDYQLTSRETSIIYDQLISKINHILSQKKLFKK